MNSDYDHPEVRDAVRRALAEDIGQGDITTERCVPAGLRARGRFTSKEPIVVAGLPLLALIYSALGGVEELQILKQEGEEAAAGAVLASVTGPGRTLLTAERTALNFLQRLSGIATLARRYTEAVRGTKARILDTRKTTPGLRRLEKLAAAAGGVTNHRMGLFDAILIKNNHIEAAGGLGAAIERARSAGKPIEVEVRNRTELAEALAAGVSRVLLDNLSPEEARECIGLVRGRASVELSGGINLTNVRAYAEAQPDFISSGAITHSALAVDINFRLELL